MVVVRRCVGTCLASTWGGCGRWRLLTGRKGGGGGCVGGAGWVALWWLAVTGFTCLGARRGFLSWARCLNRYYQCLQWGAPLALRHASASAPRPSFHSPPAVPHARLSSRPFLPTGLLVGASVSARTHSLCAWDSCQRGCRAAAALHATRTTLSCAAVGGVVV